MLRLIPFLLLAVSALAVPASQCNLNLADIGPTLTTCLNTYRAVEFSGGVYNVGSTITLPHGAQLTANGSFGTVFQALSSLTGPVISVNGKVSTKISGLQIQLPATGSGITHAILYDNAGSNSLYHVLEDCYIEDGSAATVGNRVGVEFRSSDTTSNAWAQYYARVNRNNILRFTVAIKLSATALTQHPTVTNAPSSGLLFAQNVTSGLTNVLIGAGGQQSQFTDHFCNGFDNGNRQQVCLSGGNPLGIGYAAEVRFSGIADMTGSSSVPAISHMLYANTYDFRVEILNSDLIGQDYGFRNSIKIPRQVYQESIGPSGYFTLGLGGSLDSILIGGLTSSGDKYFCKQAGKAMSLEIIPAGVGARIRAVKFDCPSPNYAIPGTPGNAVTIQDIVLY